MISIIIPTVKFDQLKPCLESIQKYTDFQQVRIIIIANGASQECKNYLEKEYPLEHIWVNEMLGFPKAVNLGIKAAGNDDVILLNDDTVLLPQEKDTWIMMLKNLFKNPSTGIAGPLRLYDYWVKQYYIHFFCAMIKREVIEKIGLLDESFGWGNCEDLDYCLCAKANGFDIASLPVKFDIKTTMKIAEYPIFHAAHKTVEEIADFSLNAEKNIKIIQERYKHLQPEKFEDEIFIT